MIVENFIDNEKELVEFIDKQKWNTSLSRRTQHYGYEYDYKSKKLKESVPIPQEFNELIQKIQNTSNLKCINQIIINEYNKGQGISAHIDHTKLFDDTIASLSLLTEATMIFRPSTPEGHEKIFILKPKSIIFMQGDLRYKYTHEIKNTKKTRRISITFRHAFNTN